MASLTNIQLALLALTIGLLFAQTLVKQKQTMHLLFALFCGSVAMATAQSLSVDKFGNYGYLIGMGACATCNVYWLLARSMFRKQNPLSSHHILFAAALGLLIMIRQGYLFADGVWQLDSSLEPFAVGILGELTVMFSSCVLLLTIWEGLNGYNQASSTEKKQRSVFLMTIISAIILCKTVLSSANYSENTNQMVVACVSIAVILITQCLIYWIHQSRHVSAPVFQSVQSTDLPMNDLLIKQLGTRLQKRLVLEQKFLQPGLKVADIARELDVSEYIISRAIKLHFGGKNFNQFVNELRVQYAQALLQDSNKQHWSVLVIGLESGFASVGPFNRAFKQITGMTPNQYRQEVTREETYECS